MKDQNKLYDINKFASDFKSPKIYAFVLMIHEHQKIHLMEVLNFFMNFGTQAGKEPQPLWNQIRILRFFVKIKYITIEKDIVKLNQKFIPLNQRNELK